MGYFLSLKDISKSFPGVLALDHVQLNVARGEIHALVGENGAGKSTLIKIMSGVYKPDPGGYIEIEENRIRLNDINESIAYGISVIYQDLSLFPNLSVAENICIGRNIGKRGIINWKNYNKLAQNTLNGMEIDIPINEILGNLSIAKQQLVAIARAIAFKSRLIIMDEPTSSLSQSEVEILFSIILTLKKDGISVLFISHKLDEVMRIADTVTVLRDGKYVGSKSKESLTEYDIIRMMVGRNIEYIKLNNTSNATKEVVVEFSHISRKGNYKDVSFKVYKGEVLGITGLVGAGRTEVIKSLFGLIPPEEGKIFLEGKEIKIKSPGEAKKFGVSFVPENRLVEGLIMEFNIFDNVNLVNYDKTKNKIGMLSYSKTVDLSKKLMEKLDVRPRDTRRKAKEFSGGNQQKIVIGKWISTNPKVLIVDEPTYGVDIGSKIEIHKLLRGMAAMGMAVIVVSSELQEILTLTDRLLVMRRGRLIVEMDTNNATQEKIMEYALLSGKNGYIQ